MNRRRARSALLLSLVCVALVAAGCGSPPGGGAQLRTYQVALTDLAAQDAETSERAQVSGLPVEGATLRMRP